MVKNKGITSKINNLHYILQKDYLSEERKKRKKKAIERTL